MERNKLSNLCGPGPPQKTPPGQMPDPSDPKRCTAMRCDSIRIDPMPNSEHKTQQRRLPPDTSADCVSVCDADADADDWGQVTFYWRLRARRPRFCYLEA
ncbi:hypothetical protein KR093_003315 [Drosophila rubida]|uniref:Uncharacterized protein n=1 Tax=Drosophila rubida TaxID=30044 RepID=A0AAD4JYR7_9MUSC|nr:hypothetical protein KR093_003315 [Drosophila rubida]